MLLSYHPSSFRECGRGEQSSVRCMRPYLSLCCSGKYDFPPRRTRSNYLLVWVFAGVSPSNSLDSEICFLVLWACSTSSLSPLTQRWYCRWPYEVLWMPLSVRLSVKENSFVPMVSWLELVYDYSLAILGMDMLLHLPDVWHHLDVASVDVYLDVVLFLLAHILNIILLLL